MTPEEIAAQEAVAAAAQAEEENKNKPPAPSQDPTKVELEKEKGKTRSELDKATFSFKKTAERIVALGGNPTEVLGVTPDVDKESEDEVPEWYKREQAKEAQKTALQLADDIADKDQRELVKSYLQTRIVPSGNPHDDLRLALAATSALKNKQIVEELSRYGAPKRTAAGGSSPVVVEEAFTPTAEEEVMMKPPYNLSEKKIIAARQRSEQKQQ